MKLHNVTSEKKTEDTSLPNSELLGLQTNAQEQANNYKSNGELVQRLHVEGTPFQVITIEQGSFIAVGNKRITEYQTKEQCLKQIEDKGWEMIATLITIIYHIMKEDEIRN